MGIAFEGKGERGRVSALLQGETKDRIADAAA
jgi:hypothetical protein